MQRQKGGEEQDRYASMVAFHAIFVEEFVSQNEHGEQGGERQLHGPLMLGAAAPVAARSHPEKQHVRRLPQDHAEERRRSSQWGVP